MSRLSGFANLLVLPLVIATVGLSTTAEARRNYCDRTDGKAQGTIIGAILGAGAGALIDHGGANGILIGAAGGGLAGRLAGHSEDARKDERDCGEDSAVIQRHIRQDDERSDRAQYQNDQRESDISGDIARSRDNQDRREQMRYGRGGYDRGGYGGGYGGGRYQRPRPRRAQYQCVALGYDNYGQRYGILMLPSQRIVETSGYDIDDCQDRATEMNRYGR